MKASYAYLAAPFISWLIAQILKNLLGHTPVAKGKVGKYLRSGGMPSAHTATVTALAVVIFVHEGFSGLFAVAAWFAAITMYDALVARRSIGEQGSALTKLLEKEKVPLEEMPRVALGHTPAEVLGGGVIGVLVGVTVALFITI